MFASTDPECRIWFDDVPPGASAAWDGVCDNGFGSGPGQLVVTWQDSSNRDLSIQFDGWLSDGRADGQGTLFYEDGGTYSGDFKDGVPNGQGVRACAAATAMR